MSSVPLKVSPMVDVTVDGNKFRVTRGTRVKGFVRRNLPHLEDSCLGAVLNNRLVGLEAPITASCTLVPVTYASKEGARIYRATLTVMLCEAFARVFPGVRIRVGQALGNGYFFEVLKTPPLSQDDLDAVELEMREMVRRNEPLATMTVPSDEAEEAFVAAGYPAKARVVRRMRLESVQLVTMGKHVDLCLHPLLPTAGAIRGFGLSLHNGGLVLGFPPPSMPEETPDEPAHCERLFEVYRETRKWNSLVGIETVADLNMAIVSGKIGEIIRVAEALHERKIAAVADHIARQRDCRLVLIAGPSASGKTTTVKRLRLQLLAIGIRPKELSLDNYYVDREKTPVDEEGEYDFECIEAIDLPLLNEQLRDLLAGKEVHMPKYSFTRGRRSDKWVPVRLEPNEILLIEGIHGLNERLTRSVESGQKIKIYVSALTQLCIDDHNRIFTSDVRLLRRIVRDRLFRGYTASESILRWPKVRRGEERHIFPFQEQADIMFNSTLVYETAVLKVFAERFLMEVREDDEAYVEASRLLDFLRLFVAVFADDVPGTSILREFIGGSAFDY